MSLKVLEPKDPKQLPELNRKCTKKEKKNSPECLNDVGGDSSSALVSVGLPGQRDAVLGHICDDGLVGRARQLEGLGGLSGRRVGALCAAKEEVTVFAVRATGFGTFTLCGSRKKSFALTVFTISLRLRSNCLTRNFSLTLSVAGYYYVVSLSSCASCEVLSTRNIACPKGLHRKPADYVHLAETIAANCLTSVAISMFPAWLH